ncbi:MAG: RusA family crossover junction endodeoxyribonuclease [Clostridiales bacterium]|nr:RusA family crossover junction endodeoxyribonuclease [Clostridiales bacterium]
MPKRNLEVFVPGTPIQQGSMKAFPIRHSNGTLGVSMVHNKGNLLTAWRERIRVALIEKYPEQLDGTQTDGGYFKQYVPVVLEVTFYLAKPKSNKLKEPSNKKADLDKLVRAVNDALSGLVFYDDSQVVKILASKEWESETHPQGVCLRVYQY